MQGGLRRGLVLWRPTARFRRQAVALALISETRWTN